MQDFNKRRIDLYNIISSLELDLRFFILLNNLDFSEYDEKIDSRIMNTIYEKNNKEHRIMFLDFSEYYHIIKKFEIEAQSKNLFDDFLNNIYLITPIRNRIMHSRPLHEDDYETVISFAKISKKYISIIPLDNLLTTFKNIGLLSSSKTAGKMEDEVFYVDNRVENNLPIVDYDDTGFVGREQKKRELIKKIRSAHPIISVTGHGGIGKTSTVLSCIYDLIESDDFPFEKVLWVTLKTKSLQNGEFKDIKNSIKSFDECIRKNDILNKESVVNIDHLLYYMGFYKTLLILDNLETIDIEEVKRLFEEIPPNSKILITSRMGIKEYESRLPLGPFDIDEAVFYFRRLVKTYNATQLSKIPDSTAKKYVKQLYLSPLCIKWFVINVAKGNSPDIVVNDQDELIEFCLSNVFDKLSEEAKQLLKIILVKNGPCSFAELMFINDNNFNATLESIYELCACSFLEASSNQEYNIPEFASRYLPKKFNLKDEKTMNIQRRINKLYGQIDNLQRDALLENKSALSMHPKTFNEKIATIYMQSFIEAHEQNDFDQMEKLFDLAQKACPNFSDIYRVAGYCYGRLKNNAKAIENFKTALNVCTEEDKPYVCSFYSLFLTNNTSNYSEAFELIDYALTIHPDEPYFLANKARTLKYTKRFNESLQMINKILENDKLDFMLKRNLLNERVDIEARRLDLTTDVDEKNNIFIEITRLLDAIESDYYNVHLYKTMLKAFRYAARAGKKSKLDSLLKKYADKYYLFILFVSDKDSINNDVRLLNQYLTFPIDLERDEIMFPKREYGFVSFFKPESGFGFINCKGGVFVFFHCSKLSFDPTLLTIETTVSFIPVLYEGRWQATDIELVSDEKDD